MESVRMRTCVIVHAPTVKKRRNGGTEIDLISGLPTAGEQWTGKLATRQLLLQCIPTNNRDDVFKIYQ